MKTIRCFLGVKLDYDTARALSDVQKELKKRFDLTDTHINWVPPPNMHITIRFLGQVTEPLTYALRAMLETVMARTQAFNMEAAGLGVFPDRETPAILWAGVTTGSAELSTLYSNVSERLLEAGFHLTDKPFSAHITLGRITKGSSAPLDDYLVENPNPSFGNTFIRNLYCYRSDIAPRGAEYHSMWRTPLAGAQQGDSHKQPTPRKQEPFIKTDGEGPNDNDINQ